MTSRQARGPLVIIGGAEDKGGECAILREVVRLAGGPAARILILPMASDCPLDTGARYAELFRALGAGEARSLQIEARAAADQPAATRAIEAASAVFFGGGTQQRIADRLAGSAFETALHRRHADGLVLAGTSAGAAAMSGVMIVEGKGLGPPCLGQPRESPGLGFLKGAIIDQHFSQRGRLGRLLAVLAHHPTHLGLGVDEDTAFVVRGDELAVIGSGSVTVIDAGALSYTNQPDLSRSGSPLALCDLKLHVLPAGLGYSLKDRRPLVPDHALGAVLGRSA